MRHAATGAKHARRGAALFTVMVIVLTGSVVLATMTTMGLSRSFTARKLSERVRAIAIAEAGANHAYSVLATNFDLRSDPSVFPLTAYGGGAFDVAVTAVSNNAATIVSTGMCGSVTETVILDVRKCGGSGPTPDLAGYGFAVLAGGEIVWTGCGQFLNDATIHANQGMKQSGSGELNCDVESSVGVTLNGNSGQIDGDVSAPSISGKTGKITGAKNVGPVPAVAIPDIDLTPYYTTALANGQVYSGNLTLSHGATPPGGVFWVNGDLNLSGNDDFTGCFIATGTISMTGGGRFTSVSQMPAVISRDGDIKIAGSASYEGLIYARIGDIDINGGCAVTGSVVCGGDFSKSGCSSVFSYVDSTPRAPGNPGTDAVLAVSAWQK